MTGTNDPLLQRIQIDPQHELVRGHTGRGVRIAVIDSGVNPRNPHIGRIEDAVAINDDGSPSQDVVDRLGHGTAVTAAIQEKAPAAEILVIKVFQFSLTTTARAIAEAIRTAAERQARLINLSLGTVKPHNIELLREAVAYARRLGAVIVSAREHDGEPWYPGALEHVAGVTLDWNCPRESIAVQREHDSGPVFRASGFPRPVPGVPAERNIKGVSFAVANVTGVLACVLEQHPAVRTSEDLLQLLGLAR